MPSFNHQKAVAYARRYAHSTNPQYPRFGQTDAVGEDCTNFVSQAMLAGGWTMVGVGMILDQVIDHALDWVWWYGQIPFTQTRASYTWSSAPNFARWIVASQRGVRAKDPMELQPGDVIQLREAGTKQIGHTAIVTGKTGTDLLLTYHSHDKLDESFNSIVRRLPGAEFIPWKISSSFSNPFHFPIGVMTPGEIR